ncbi:MAG: hydrogenase subunit MbhD domain-containing protein [Thiobacillus sp.]
MMGFDLLLAAAIIWSAVRALTLRDAAHAVVLFIVFGLLMTLAWVRLDAPDIALAEAAIGAGLTGALLLDALGAFRRMPPAAGTGGWTRAIILAASGMLLFAFIHALLAMPYGERVVLPEWVAAQVSQSGVTHPVTAVLLNFRGYDTLLEVGVLLVALIALPAAARSGKASRKTAVNPMLRAFASAAAPLGILAAGYLLWAGAHRPGGAFQAGAMVAAAAVLLHLSGRLPAWVAPGRLLRAGLAGGLLFFLAAGLFMTDAGAYLTYPPPSAGSWILAIEAGLTISLGLALAGLFLVLAGQGRAQ